MSEASSKRLYRVIIVGETVVLADSHQGAVEAVDTLLELTRDLNDELSENATLYAHEVTAPHQLPAGWGVGQIPWNDDDDRTVGQYLADEGGKDA